MTPLLSASVIVYVINAIILSVLAYIYARTAVRSRAAYPASLLVFSILLLVHSAGTAAVYTTMASYFGDDPQPFMLETGIAEMLGLLFLLKITL